MKVLLATGVYPPRIGGPARQVHDLALALKNSNTEVAVLTFGDKERMEENSGIRVYYVKDKFKLFKLWRKYSGIKRMLKRIHREFKPEIVHSNSVRFLAFWVGSYARKNKIPAITKYAGDFVYEKINQNFLAVADVENVFRHNIKARILTIIEKKILNKFDFVWAQSNYQRSILVGYLKVKPEKVIVMPNYINIPPQVLQGEELNDNVKESALQSKRKIILSTSRFVPWKNLEAQVFVAKKLKELTIVPFFLYLVGGGDARILEKISRLVRENNLTNEVKIFPPVSPLEIGKMFKQADVYLSTSLYEPFGVVFVEAMAIGLPIVALGACSVPEIIKDGHVGFVVKRGPNYIDYIAERLKVIVENDDIYEYFARNSLKEAEKYDLKSNIGKFINLYRRMTNG